MKIRKEEANDYTCHQFRALIDHNGYLEVG